MSVIKFPKKYKPPPVAPLTKPDIARMKAAVPWSTVRGILSFAWMIIRVPVFLVLYWLRLPVMLVCNLISMPALLAFLFSWYAFPEKTHMVVAFGVVSFAAFALLYLYDVVLMSLSPQEMMRTL